MQVTPLLAVILFLIGVWYIVGVGLARAGGWSALAQRYQAAGAPDGKKFSMQSVGFGWVDYNGGITIRVSSQGLYLATWSFLLVGHPPLLIPWASLQVLKVRETFWKKDVTLAVDDPPIARIRLPLRIIEAAQGLLTTAKDGAEES